MWTVSDTRSAHAKGATEAEAELASQHLAVVENGSVKSSVVMKRQDEHCAQRFIPNQRQKVQSKQQLGKPTRVEEVSPEMESWRN